MVEAPVGLILGPLVGAGAGLATPVLAARFGVLARWWMWLPVGVTAGLALGRLDDRHLPAWLVVLAVGVPLAAIDLGAHRLPDALVLPAAAGAAVLVVAGGSTGAVVAGAVLAATYAVLAVLPRSALGFGDVKLAGLLGLALGQEGWQPVVGGTALAFVLGGVVALALLMTGRASRDTMLPFGPAMLAGAWLAVVL